MHWFIFFNDTATTEIYTLSLHDALPICPDLPLVGSQLTLAFVEAKLKEHRITPYTLAVREGRVERFGPFECELDRKSTRLNSSHANISYAVFCLKKKKSLPANSTMHHAY